MKRINKAVIKRMIDRDPDTSWLGEYSDTSKSEFTIDRAHSLDCPINTGVVPMDSKTRKDELTEPECDCDERGDMKRMEYRYFNPSLNYVAKDGTRLPENTAEEVRKYVRQNYERLESLNRGNWCHLGIRADVQYIGNGNAVIQTVTSGAVWGIESDSSEAYFTEVEQEQLSELRDQLEAIGFSSRAISAAFKNVERRYL